MSKLRQDAIKRRMSKKAADKYVYSGLNEAPGASKSSNNKAVSSNKSNKPNPFMKFGGANNGN